MGIDFYNEDYFVLHLNDYIAKYLNVFTPNSTKVNIQSDFKKIIAYLRDNLKVKVNGYYNILVHEFKNFGYIIEFDRREDDEDDVDDVLSNYLEMKVIFKFHEDVVVEIEDYDYLTNFDDVEKVDIYYYYGKYYLVIKGIEPNSHIIGSIYEYGKVYYHDEIFKREGINVFNDIEIKKLSF